MAPPRNTRKSIGLGFIPKEARKGFLLRLPRTTAREGLVLLEERNAGDLEKKELDQPSPTDPNLRVVIDYGRWKLLAPAFWEDANRRLRANGLPSFKYLQTSAANIPIHLSLGKELCILCWAVEDAPPDQIPNALHNWEALAPEERWWLYTMTVATTGQASQKGIGWRKALRAALTDNPFIKGEGLSPRSRRELLGHQQMALGL